jgi:collagenase-like PrtC family protease
MSARLSLGPVFFNWAPEAWRDFYFRVADEAPVDAVYVGEVVCAKRSPFLAPLLESVVDRLRNAGKQVILSSLALIGNEREAAAMVEATGSEDFPVEINDIGLIPATAERPFHLGPFINVYNESTLSYLAKRGACRVCLPPELPASSIVGMAKNAPVELEVVAFGRLPLAISARCFHARSEDLHKDGCQFVCGRDPNGITVQTLDDEPFLVINGMQTLSYTCCNLIDEIDTLAAAGIGRFRLLPLAIDMVAVAQVFRDRLDGRLSAEDALGRLHMLSNGLIFSNGFLHGKEGRRFLPSGA